MIIKDERRNFSRMSVHGEATIKRQSGEQLTGMVRNLSATGLSVTLIEALVVGEQVAVCVHSTGERIQPLESIANVIRVTAEGDSYEAGLAIESYK